jgi:hypothetical protein
MGLEQTLLSQGYTLPGAPRNTINPDGSFGPASNPMMTIMKGIQTYMTQKKVQDQEKQKKMKESGDTYKTLRDAGYSPEKAHAAVISGDYPKDVPGLTIDDEKDKASLEKTTAETGLLKAQTETTGLKKNTIESGIMNKLAQGIELNPGEQKIYDDVIKKKNNGGLAELLSQMDRNSTGLEGTPANDNKSVDADVQVMSPDGVKGKIKASKLPAALAKGFKKVS